MSDKESTELPQPLMKICRLVKSVLKESEWIRFSTPNSGDIKILIKDDPYSRKKFKIVMDCPSDIKISTEYDDNIGNR